MSYGKVEIVFSRRQAEVVADVIDSFWESDEAKDLPPHSLKSLKKAETKIVDALVAYSATRRSNR